MKSVDGVEYLPVRWNDGSLARIPRPRIYASEPKISIMRFAVLPIENGSHGWVIYDRYTSRITNGVFYHDFDNALEVAAYCSARGCDEDDMQPAAAALGLIFPDEKLVMAIKKQQHITTKRFWE